LISGSYPVLFASLAAHAAQFAFLVLFENPRMFRCVLCVAFNSLIMVSKFLSSFPDIERMYGQRKLMSMRTPVIVSDAPLGSEATRDQMSTGASSSSARISKHVRNYSSDEPTPSATEGDTATDTDELMETETEEEDKQHTPRIANRRLSPRPSQFALNDGTSPRRPQSASSQHDLLARYFRKDPIGLRNLDLMRSVAIAMKSASTMS
jgi:phosphatidylethanolamine N-methyltransferase